MPEGRQGRDQFNMPLPAVSVQLQDVLRLQRILVAPGFAEIPEQIGMLNVQLELVDLVFTQEIHKLLQRVQFQHASAGDILIETPVQKIRPVFDSDAGKHCAVAADPLPQGADPVEQRFVASSGDPDSVFGHSQLIAFRRQRRIFIQEQATRKILTAEDTQVQAR